MADVKPLILDSGTIKQMGTGDTIPVANGGTGATTLTSHGVLLGNGTGVVAATAEGATGQVLTGVTGGNPVWGAASLPSSYIGKSIAIYKASTESITTSTSVQDDNDFSLALGVSESWRGCIFLDITAASGGGLKTAWTLPSGGTGTKAIHSAQAGVGVSSFAIASESGNNNASTAGMGAVMTFTITNSTTAGTAQLKWAQNTSNATATTIRAGSLLIATRIS